MSEITVIDSDKNLLFYGNLENIFGDKTIDRLKSGIELIFQFSFEIYKTAPDIPNELITSNSFQNTIKYDILKDDYIVSLENETQYTTNFKSFIDAKKRLEIINDVPLTSLNMLIPESNYTIRIKVEREQKAKDLSPNTIMPLIKQLSNKTIWYEIKFVY
ncbi:MAG: DUF4390 domain-containing protein [Desulfotalea sp.]